MVLRAMKLFSMIKNRLGFRYKNLESKCGCIRNCKDGNICLTWVKYPWMYFYVVRNLQEKNWIGLSE
jgi:hypothetical protein